MMKSLHCCLLGRAAAGSGRGDAPALPACLSRHTHGPTVGRGLCPPVFWRQFPAKEGPGIATWWPAWASRWISRFSLEPADLPGGRMCATMRGASCFRMGYVGGCCSPSGEPGGAFCPCPALAAKQSWERHGWIVSRVLSPLLC